MCPPGQQVPTGGGITCSLMQTAFTLSRECVIQCQSQLVDSAPADRGHGDCRACVWRVLGTCYLRLASVVCVVRTLLGQLQPYLASLHAVTLAGRAWGGPMAPRYYCFFGRPLYSFCTGPCLLCKFALQACSAGMLGSMARQW